MKTYCRKTDITSDEHLNYSFDLFSSKSGRRRGFRHFFDKGRERITHQARSMILNRELRLNDITYFYRTEPTSQKTRLIGRESAMQQFLDYVAVTALQPMLDAKIGYHQCASIKGKGQSHAARYLKRWVRNKKNRYYVKIDIRKFYESIDRDVLMAMLRHDVGNDDLLWLVEALINTHKKGLNIGSFLSQYLANYYLSEAYRYANELHKYRRGKRIKLAPHILTYMDDWIFIGHSKSDIKSAVRKTIAFIESRLHLVVKPWKICRIDSEPVDMVGWVFRRDRTSVRAAIFIRARRAFMRAARQVVIRPRLAARCISYWGYMKWANVYLFIQKHDLINLISQCKDSISRHANERKAYENLLYKPA